MIATFTPLVTDSISAVDTAMLPLKVLAQADVKAVFQALPESAKEAQPEKNCGQPTVTLQRQGEVVSGIRIQCACGQVIELVCAY
jgi:hypothetical protein